MCTERGESVADAIYVDMRCECMRRINTHTYGGSIVASLSRACIVAYELVRKKNIAIRAHLVHFANDEYFFIFLHVYSIKIKK